MSTVRIDLTDPWNLIPAMLGNSPGAVAAIPVQVPHDPDSSLVLTAKVRTQPIPRELAERIAQEQAAASGGTGGPQHAESPLPTHIEVGRLLLAIPSDLARNLHGPVGERHVAYLVVVHREAYDAAARQAETGIVLPGMEMGVPAGPIRIVKP